VINLIGFAASKQYNDCFSAKMERVWCLQARGTRRLVQLAHVTATLASVNYSNVIASTVSMTPTTIRFCFSVFLMSLFAAGIKRYSLVAFTKPAIKVYVRVQRMG
jgi:hypothetical protein